MVDLKVLQGIGRPIPEPEEKLLKKISKRKGFKVYLTDNEASLLHEALAVLLDDYQEGGHPEEEALDKLQDKLNAASNKANPLRI